MNKRQMEDFIINSYDAGLINSEPKSVEELFNMYQQHTDILYQYVRLNINYFMFSLNNEIRAIFGHISEYEVSNDPKIKERELEDAYGHFRRLNLDAFKYVCNKYDMVLFKEMKKQYKFDYRNVKVGYLKEYAKKYFEAKTAYIQAQQEERVGSDRNVHNVIQLYHTAAKAYIELLHFSENNKDTINKEQFKAKMKKVRNGFITGFSIGVTIWGLLPYMKMWIEMFLISANTK